MTGAAAMSDAQAAPSRRMTFVHALFFVGGFSLVVLVGWGGAGTPGGPALWPVQARPRQAGRRGRHPLRPLHAWRIAHPLAFHGHEASAGPADLRRAAQFGPVRRALRRRLG